MMLARIHAFSLAIPGRSPSLKPVPALRRGRREMVIMSLGLLAGGFCLAQHEGGISVGWLLAGAAALMLAGLVGAVLLRRLVHRRSVELETANDLLRREVAERRQVEE